MNLTNWFKPRDNREHQEDRIWDAKRFIVHKEAFFGYMLENMRVKLDKPKAIRGENWYAAADGRTIFLNPEWTKDLPDWELQSVLMHEMLHNALLHPLRKGDRDWKMWNVAADFIVNHRMQQHGFKLGSDWLNPSMLHSMGLGPITEHDTVEDVYDRLQQMSDKQKQQMLEAAGLSGQDQEGEGEPTEGDGSGKGPKKPGKGGGMGGDVMDGPELEAGEDRSDVENEAKSNLGKAIERGKKEGRVPGDMEQFYKRLITSNVSWRDRVRQFLGGGRLKEPTWTRPNRRFLHSGTYIPGNGAYGPGEVVIVIDTSGSIDDRLLQTFVDEVDKAHADFACEALHVICVDTRVQWAESFGPYDEVEVKAKGRGGTQFSPAFKWIADQGIDPKAVIYFTDLYSSDFGPKPEYPVHWIVWPGGGDRVPWGEIVRM